LSNTHQLCPANQLRQLSHSRYVSAKSAGEML
jgi:hypothetical protein